MTEVTLNLAISEATDGCHGTDSTHSQPVVEFREVYHKQTLQDFQEVALFQVLHPNINGLSHFLLAMLEKLSPILHGALASKKGVVFLVAIKVADTHPPKELIDIDAK